MRRFWRGVAHILGWTLSISASADPRPSAWSLSCSLFYWRGRKTPSDCIPTIVNRRFAAFQLDVGPVSALVMATRDIKMPNYAAVLHAAQRRELGIARAAHESESPLTGVRSAIYFKAE